MKNINQLTLIALTTLPLLGACASTPKADPLPPIPQVTGPKRTIAVGDFGANGAFLAQYGSWDLGGGVAAMLTTALSESGRFIVLERPMLQGVLAEQELGAQGLTKRESAPPLGNLTGAQLMVYGNITEFSMNDEGGSFGLGVAGNGLGSMLGGAFSKKTTRGTVGIDLRIVDTATGEVVTSKNVRASIDAKATSIDFGIDGLSLGGDNFKKTPIGKATREAVEKAVRVCAVTANKVEWSGRVADVSGEELILNVGRTAQVQVGDRFIVRRVSRVVTDPDTGRVIGTRKVVLGEAIVTEVEEQVAYAQFSGAGGQNAERGDLVFVQG